MRKSIEQALKAGVEQLVAWADVLDRINVFPVPDGDTGRNLVISLSPLRHGGAETEALSRSLLLSARGNSGNIAARFFEGFLTFQEWEQLPAVCRLGRDLAYQAVRDPKAGTMLSLFDALVDTVDAGPAEGGGDWPGHLVRELGETVKATTAQLPELGAAGVVDAGALGMLVFLDAFFCTLVGRKPVFSELSREMKETFRISDTYQSSPDLGYCMDVVLDVGEGNRSLADLRGLLDRPESMVAIPHGNYLKVHLHSEDQEWVRRRLETVGNVVRWSVDDLADQTRRFSRPAPRQAVHIMTDGAGSITRAQAAEMGITLLDSYIQFENTSLPETFVDREALFRAMRAGRKVSTAQASDFERHQCYRKVLDLHDRVLYVCVGSFYTGNYAAAVDWKREADSHDRLVILDSGVASGKLGLAVLAAAEVARSAGDPETVIRFARNAVRRCQEVLFLDRLQYLAAGGRMSRTGAFFGDMLHVKPVVTPTPEGAKKVAVVRNRKDQAALTLERLQDGLSPEEEAVVMLEHTDNREWLEQEILPKVSRRFPGARIMLQPLSLTSAAHMGPGSWGVAFLPGHPGGPAFPNP